MTRSHLRTSAHTAAALLVLAAATGCAGTRVTRMDPATATELSGRWNDTDSRLVASQLIDESLGSTWLSRYTESVGTTPTVIVGEFRNNTMEHIPVATFVKDLERAFISSGTVRVVASPEERVQVRDERYDQQEHARAETRTRLAQELGAQYMLQGGIEAIEDAEGRDKVVYYQIDATLVDIESNVKVWTGQKKIKKYIERSAFRY
jgi:penicillin-binding protein activator